MSDYIGTIYINPKIEFCNENNFMSVRAKENISFSEILITELTLSASKEKLCQCITYNRSLYDTYHPRINKWNEAYPDKINNTNVVEKIIKNMFSTKKQNVNTLTNKITAINHSCKSNCCPLVPYSNEINGNTIIVMHMVATNNITAGSEILFSYNSSMHKQKTYDLYGFKCQCGLTRLERLKRYAITLKLKNLIIQSDNVTKMIYDYINSKEGMRVLFYQYMLNKGVVINEDKIIVYNDDGINFAKNVVKKRYGVECEATKDELDIGGYKVKIGLFLSFIVNLCINEINQTSKSSFGENIIKLAEHEFISELTKVIAESKDEPKKTEVPEIEIDSTYSISVV